MKEINVGRGCVVLVDDDDFVQLNKDEDTYTYHISAIKEILISQRKGGYAEALQKIESLIDEFGDDPKACLGIIEEYIHPPIK